MHSRGLPEAAAAADRLEIDIVVGWGKANPAARRRAVGITT
ncbi:MAG: hypothetical protein R3F14_40050 [Polyangiaceae bacterium]